MGMYTELYLSVKFKKDLPDNVEAVICFLFGSNEDDELANLPDHEFFKCERWPCIGRMASYYFVPFSTSKLYFDGGHTGRYYLTTRSDLKNYDDEIKKFLNWIMPYLDHDEGDHLGHYRYEERDVPTLIFYSTEQKGETK